MTFSLQISVEVKVVCSLVADPVEWRDVNLLPWKLHHIPLKKFVFIKFVHYWRTYNLFCDPWKMIYLKDSLVEKEKYPMLGKMNDEKFTNDCCVMDTMANMNGQIWI